MNLLALPPLLAVDVVQIVIFILFVVGSIIGQIMNVWQERAKAPKVKPRPRPAPTARPEIDREIAEFLQQAKGKSTGAGGAAASRSAPATPAAPGSRSTASSSTKQQRPSDRSATNPTNAPRKTGKSKPRAPVAAEVVQPNESFGGHVNRHILTGGIGQRNAHLGEEIGQADERIEGHLSSVFDHQVGQLSHADRQINTISQGTDASIYKAPGSNETQLATQIRAMLASPQQAGAALVLSEILRRPEERW